MEFRTRILAHSPLDIELADLREKAYPALKVLNDIYSSYENMVVEKPKFHVNNIVRKIQAWPEAFH
ncbi:MAG: hypothetical protein DRJ33_01705 [Candidatus Methanomethylicota archaeon]|uniref:Uncharacterized protein n=1 Tax=Thermoproteota archaeon TaxID=2056631 RepID=A0A497F146_9CREN|nr:MAG: hypothetical protein DRJ33_01705 [Candidatus Verstraetearchaeota archaeon]